LQGYHGLSRPVRHAQRGHVTALPEGYVGHNAGIRTGFSGGPLLDAHGRLLGIHRLVHFSASFGYAVRAENLFALLAIIPD